MENKESVTELKKEIVRLNKVVKALMGRVERSTHHQNNAFALFEGNILLSTQVKERTQKLEQLSLTISQEKNKLSHIINALPGKILIFNTDLYIQESYSGIHTQQESPLSKNTKLSEHFDHDFIESLLTCCKSIQEPHRTAFFEHFKNKGTSEEQYFYCTVSQINKEQRVLYIQDKTDKYLQDQVIKVKDAQIIQASKLSELGEMAGGIAHEINTPLGIIMLLAGQIKSLSPNSPEQNLTKAINISKKIQTTVTRIASIVKSLRQISRNESQEQLSNCKLKNIIHDALDLCRERFSAHGVSIKTELPKDDLFVKAKPVQLSQVMLNLLNNSFAAIRHSKSPWIKILCTDLDTHIRISVIDSGLGIEKDTLNKVFDPFFTTKELGEGTGLGLSISKQIVSDHNSTLQYVLHEQQNTCFFFDIKKS